MAQNFLACDREQSFLLPPDLRDWLPEDHLAWFVVDVVGVIDLSGFYAGYREERIPRDQQYNTSATIIDGSYAARPRPSSR